MKFLCDRCKTRYSIGDDRVRGKILKIRCKNCSNVITVREGMVADVDAVPPPEYAGRTKPTTTTSPAAHEERAAEAATVPARPATNAGSTAGPNAVGRAKEPARTVKEPARTVKEPARVAKEPASGSVAEKLPRAESSGEGARGQGGRRAPQESRRNEPVNALNAAFASAMAKPPPALEEEWYVSIDGAQSGPFSLVEAQQWVGQKPFDAELHCWSEGFDDWLPVDKVSHFRGLRKRPAPAPPPPMPRAGGSPRPVATAPAALPVEDQSKPLFAATMATLERAAPVAPGPGIQLPPAGAMSGARATPAHGVGYPSNRGNAPGNGAGSGNALGNSNGSGNAFGNGNANGPSIGNGPGNGAGNGMNGAFADASVRPDPMLARPTRGNDPFDVGAGTGPGHADAATQIGQPLDPFAAMDRNAPAVPSDFAGGGDGDNDLHIGEVSRVVNLADIARTPRPNPAAVPRRAPTAAVSRLTNANPVLRSTQGVPNLSGTGVVTSLDGAPPSPAEGDPALTMAPVAKSHRRGLITLLSVAIVLVLGVAAAVILFVTDHDTLTGDRLGQVHDIDTSRPEDPITHRPLPPGTTPTPPTNPFVPRTVPRVHPTNPVDPGHDVDPPPGGSLRSEEIEDMARKHQDMTQRCYMRSQRGADSILVGDVKKITVTLTIDREGGVSDVGLSEHAADNLGKCLITSMKTWKFRASAGGAFRISLNFVSG